MPTGSIICNFCLKPEVKKNAHGKDKYQDLSLTSYKEIQGGCSLAAGLITARRLHICFRVGFCIIIPPIISFYETYLVSFMSVCHLGVLKYISFRFRWRKVGTSVILYLRAGPDRSTLFPSIQCMNMFPAGTHLEMLFY